MMLKVICFATNLMVISVACIYSSDGSGVKDECVLRDARKHYRYIEIRIKSCKGMVVKVLTC